MIGEVYYLKIHTYMYLVIFIPIGPHTLDIDDAIVIGSVGKLVPGFQMKIHNKEEDGTGEVFLHKCSNSRK